MSEPALRAGAATPPSLPASDLDHVLRHTEGVWSDLRGARVFITGGTGFFGRWLAESFVAANRALQLGAEAIVLTRDPDAAARRMPDAAADRSVRFVRGDVRDFAFPHDRATHVIHGATTASAALNAERPSEMFSTIVDGTRRTMDYASDCGARRVLLLSSGAVYGVQPPALEHVDEDYAGGPNPLDPGQAYAEGKRAAELAATLAARSAGFELSVARCFAFVGPGLPLDAHFAIGNFIRDAMRGGPIRLTGDGTPYRSYQYPADLMIWLWTLLVRGPAGRAYNVGSDHAVQLYDLAHLIADLAPTRCEVVRALEPDLSRPAARYVPCTRRAERELGLTERITLPDAIERTMRWHQSRHVSSQP